MPNDRLIDEVACTMTTAAVRPELRAPVLAAIDREDVRRAAPWRVARVRATAAVAAAAVMALAVSATFAWQLRSRHTPQTETARVLYPNMPASGANPRPPTAIEAPHAGMTTTAGAHGAAASPARRAALAVRTTIVVPTADELAWQAGAVPPLAGPIPLAGPTALTLSSGQPATSSIPLLEVTPIVNAPIDVMPIDADDSTGGA